MARERDDYDDDDDRPSRRRDRDDDDRDVELSGMDVTFNNNFVILLLVSIFCCSLVGLIYGIMGLTQCKDPSNKTKALILLIISAISIGLGIVINVANAGK